MNYRAGLLAGFVWIGIAGLAQGEESALNADTIRKNVDNYFAAWNEPDAKKRMDLLSDVWAENAFYTDPGAYVSGRQALADHIETFLTNPQFEGFQIVLTSGIDLHHRHARFTWSMLNKDGGTVMEGIDFAEFDDEDRITYIVGFFGELPSKPE